MLSRYMSNSYLSMFALTFILTLLCMIPQPAAAAWSPFCLHSCNDGPYYYTDLSGEYTAPSANAEMWCDEVHPPSPYCSPVTLTASAIASVVIDSCPSNWGSFIASSEEQVANDVVYSKIMVGLSAAPGVVLADAYIIKNWATNETLEADSYVAPGYSCLHPFININE